MSEGFLDIVVFLEGKDGKKKPQSIGWAKMEGGEAKGRIDVMPVRGWDGSFKIQARRDRPAAPQGNSGGASRSSNALPPADDDIPF